MCETQYVVPETEVDYGIKANTKSALSRSAQDIIFQVHNKAKSWDGEFSGGELASNILVHFLLLIS